MTNDPHRRHCRRASTEESSIEIDSFDPNQFQNLPTSHLKSAPKDSKRIKDRVKVQNAVSEKDGRPTMMLAYDHHVDICMTMATIDSTPQKVDDPVPSSKSRVRRERKPRSGNRLSGGTSSASAVTQTTANKGSILWTILLAGLVFSLVDLFYIANYLERTEINKPTAQNSSPIKIPSEFLSTNFVESPKDDHPQLHREESSSNADTDDNTNTDADTDTDAEHATVIAERSVENPKEESKDTDKGPILNLLKDAGIDLDSLEQKVVDSLPLWSTVVKLYGDKPRIVGLDTCMAFRSSGDPADHFLGVAGTFNTGTNLMSELFIANCHMPARMAKFGKVNRGIRWQVPWGKHTPVTDDSYRLTHKTEKDSGVDPSSVFPAVTVRDPAAWMQSMCRHEYSMSWPHNKTTHCPNLVPSDSMDYDISPLSQSTNSSVPVTIHYKEFNKEHDSLLHHWNEWYTAYTAAAKFPRVLVRFEDLIFHPVEVTTAACECAGGAMKRDLNGRLQFKYVTGSAKKGDAHGKDKTGYIDAIIRYGNDRGDRWKGMTEADLKYTRDHLDPTLMALFGYHYPSEATTTRI